MSLQLKVLSYPDPGFLNESWSGGGQEELRDDLATFWFSPIEILVNGVDILRPALDIRWQAKLAIPVGDFLYTWECLVKASLARQDFREKLIVSHGVEDSLYLVLEKLKDGSDINSLKVVDDLSGQILAEGTVSGADVVMAFGQLKDSINAELKDRLSSIGISISEPLI